MLRCLKAFIVTMLVFAIASPLYAGSTSELEKKLMELQQEYQKKFDELKSQIDEMKKSSDEIRKSTDEQKALQQKQIEEIQKATKEKEETNKKELEILQAKMEEQKKLSLQAGYDKGFFIKSADDQFLIKIGGYLQTDLRIFEGSENRSNQPDTFDIRRARLVVGGNLYKYFEYKLETELNQGSGSSLTDAFLNVNYTSLAEFQVGQFKKPIGYESPISDSVTDYITKAIVVENIVGAPDARDIGAMLHGILFEKKLAYYLSIVNGTGKNSLNDSHDFSFAGSVVASPFVNTNNFFLKGINLGGSLLVGNRQSHKSSEISLAGRNKLMNGLSVDGQRFVLGPELVWYIGPFGLKSEYYYQSEERNNIPEKDDKGNIIAYHNMKDLLTKGYYVSAMYMLTGENMGENIVPKNNFDPFKDGWGAWEVAARFEGLGLHKDVRTDPIIKGENILSNNVTALTLGLNWYLNQNVKLMLNYVANYFDKVEKIKDPSIGDKESVFLTRVQFKF